jgi:hypothetical protein
MKNITKMTIKELKDLQEEIYLIIEDLEDKVDYTASENAEQ